MIETINNALKSRPPPRDIDRASGTCIIGRAKRYMEIIPAAIENKIANWGKKVGEPVDPGFDTERRTAQNAGKENKPGIPTRESPDRIAAEKATGFENARPRKSAI